MRLLVLGGSAFVGRAVVDAGLRRGWQVTVFNRGTAAATAGAEHIRGDRTVPADLAPLRERNWDAVVDTWRYAPRAVQASCAALAGRVGHYGYVSSVSVYAWPPPTPVAEDACLVEPSEDPGTDDYPKAKSGAESAVLGTFGDRTLLARAGLILGPYEYAGRLPWWLLRFAEYDRVLAPEPADRPVQYVDARDLAEWMLSSALAGRAGPFNLVCPRGHATMGGLLEACADAVGSGARMVWRSERSLLQAGVRSWVGLPIWLPTGDELSMNYDIDVAKAMAAGLVCRPLGQTVRDTWEWLASADPSTTGQHKPWLSREEEVALLDGC